ncbi:MAG TPA: UDP-N-acetylmuramate dehydrogenase [Cyclobacteriaceae bacterium]|nr:UDP-N-acetylmuramate dehydrogenase [Cyclobacteriaceae bacterium]
MIIQEQVDLYPYNTFKIHAKAKYFTSIHSVSDFQELVKSQVYKQEKRLLLGGGSNMLLTGDFQGLVIRAALKGIDIVSQTDDTITVKAGAGVIWHELVLHSVAQDWGGIENLSLIPGTVGAAPIQNIGAYGVEVKEVIKNVEAIDLVTGEVRVFENEECKFGYRESVFKERLKGKYFISSVTLTFTKKNHRFNTSYGAIEATLKQQHVTQLSVRAISDAVIAIRQSKLPDPNKIGNAGSFFKNPTITQQHYEKLKIEHPEIPGYSAVNQQVKVPAGWLIETCGWKGKTFENIGVHPHQALVIVNYGGGTGAKIWELAQKILHSVKEKFDIELQPEVNVI